MGIPAMKKRPRQHPDRLHVTLEFRGTTLFLEGVRNSWTLRYDGGIPMSLSAPGAEAAIAEALKSLRGMVA